MVSAKTDQKIMSESKNCPLDIHQLFKSVFLNGTDLNGIDLNGIDLIGIYSTGIGLLKVDLIRRSQ
jgi:uncharacterized protein YjbI with pentapeptide repeats